MEGWIFLLWVCLSALLIGLFIRLVDYLFREKKKASACMAQWPAEVVEKLKQEGRRPVKYNMISTPTPNEITIEEFERIYQNDKNNGEIKFRPILPASPVPFMGLDPACSDNNYSPTVITGYQDEKGVYHVTSVENHSSMTIEEIVERYGPLNSVLDTPVRENPRWKQLEEEQNLKLLACLFRVSQDGNSPYAIGRA